MVSASMDLISYSVDLSEVWEERGSGGGGKGSEGDVFGFSFGLMFKVHMGHPGRCMGLGPQQSLDLGPPNIKDNGQH